MSKHRHVHVRVYIFFCIFRDLESGCDRQVSTRKMVRQAWSNIYCVYLKRPRAQITWAFCRHTRRRFECTTHGGVFNPHTGIFSVSHHTPQHQTPRTTHNNNNTTTLPPTHHNTPTHHTHTSCATKDGELCVVCGCVACACVCPYVCVNFQSRKQF